MQPEVVEYRSREYYALESAGYVIVESWIGADGVSWVRMEFTDLGGR